MNTNGDSADHFATFSLGLDFLNEAQKRKTTELTETDGKHDSTNLRRYYAEVRNKSGESYCKFSLLGFRHSFERYLNAPPLSWGLVHSLTKHLKRRMDTKFWSFTWPNSILSAMLSFSIQERILSGIMEIKFGSTPNQLVPTNSTGWWKALERKRNSPNVHQPQGQSPRNHLIVECWCTKPPHNGNLWSPQWTESFTLQHHSSAPSRSEVLSRSLTSNRSESLAVTIINIQKEVQENSIVLSTTTEKTTSRFGSFFNNCTNVQTFQTSMSLLDQILATFGIWQLLSHCFQCLLNSLFSVIDVLCEEFWLALTLCSNFFLRTAGFLTELTETENVACCKLANKKHFSSL